MLKRVIFVVIFCCSCILIQNVVKAEDSKDLTGSASLMYGFKSLNTDDWSPVEKQQGLGLRFDLGKKDSDLMFAFDYLSSNKKDNVSEYVSGYGNLNVGMEGKTTELCLGVRKYFRENGFSTFVGGGLANITADVSASASGYSVSDSDSSIGIWIDGGALFNFSQNLQAGAELRYSKATVTLFGVSGEAGGVYSGIFVGLHW